MGINVLSRVVVSEEDIKWMRSALTMAQRAQSQDEVPVGAVIVYNGEALSQGWNQPITLNDPSAHAEILAIRAAGQSLKNYRLCETTLYVTLEPCAMCLAAMVHARIGRLVFGAYDFKTGAVESSFSLLEQMHFNHQFPVQGGVLADECGAMLSAFFKEKRTRAK